MNISVTNYEKRYEIEVETIAQLCGHNIQRKNYIIESINRYFGNYKYSEDKNPWRDNVFVDGEKVGRKQLQVITIRNRIELLSLISFTKQGILTYYVKDLLQSFDIQKKLEKIDQSLEDIIHMINKEMYTMGDFQLSYDMKNVWEMVQNTELVSKDMLSMDEKSNYDLLCFFLGLIDKTNIENPSRRIIILENLDHLVTNGEYSDLVTRMSNLANKSEIRFICTISLDNFVVINDELITQIAILNDVDFILPDIEIITEFIEKNYPIQVEFDRQYIFDTLKHIINDIGRCNSLNSLNQSVICKAINKSLMINESIEMPINKAFQAFFLS